MIAPEAGLSVARSSFYYRPRPESSEELELLKRLDRVFTDGTALRNSHSATRYRTARTRAASLCTGSVGS
jgi:hypothetical protein